MKAFKVLVLSSFLLISSVETYAQCAMCRRVTESSTEAKDNKVGRGLNTGILYLLAIPYVLGGVGVYMWYKNKSAVSGQNSEG